MAQFQPKQSDIIKCVDIFSEIKDAQWLLQSMNDAISSHWTEPELIKHIAYLVDDYSSKMQNLVPRLDEAFKKIESNGDFEDIQKFLTKKFKE